MFSLSVLNFTHGFVWFFFRYWSVHIAECGLSVGTEMFTLLCVVCLSVVNCKNVVFFCLPLLKLTDFCLRALCLLLNSTVCSLWSVYLYWSYEIAVCVYFQYGNLHIAEFGLPHGTEFYMLLCVVCLSFINSTNCCALSAVRYWTVHIDVCGLSVGTELYTLLCVVGLSVLNFTHWCVWAVCRYWNINTALCGLNFGTEIYTLLCVICLWVLTLHIAVCGHSVGTEHYTLLYTVPLLVLNCTYCGVCSVCRYRTL